MSGLATAATGSTVHAGSAQAASNMIVMKSQRDDAGGRGMEKMRAGPHAEEPAVLLFARARGRDPFVLWPDEPPAG